MTQAAPVQHGQQALTDKISPVEQVIEITGINYAVATGTAGTWDVATVTMPWEGQLTATINTQGNYPAGLVQVSHLLSTSAPVPAVNYAGSMTNYQDVGTSYDFVTGMAQWRDLPKGQVVTVRSRVQLDVGNVAWNVMAFIGWLRLERI